MQYCEINARHENGLVEHTIRFFSETSHTLIRHPSMRWKSGIDSSLYHMAVDYATFVYTHLPNESITTPNNIS